MSAALVEITAEIVAPAMGVSARSVFDITPRRRRTQPEALARSAVIYLAHTGAKISMRALEDLLWVERRDLRRTIQMIEEAREDVDFDGLMARLEEAVRTGAFQ